MTTHQQDSSQPQQSHDSPQEVEMGLGLMMDVMEEVVLPGILIVVVERSACGVFSWVSSTSKFRCGLLGAGRESNVIRVVVVGEQ